MGHYNYPSFNVKENLKAQCVLFDYCPYILVFNPHPDLHRRGKFLCPLLHWL